ncbi:MAG TPA: asparagine synthase (glutamine-hydrolyzing) [Gemmataceae bacterium]|nr:asparagine synthase (glutamine-hydrolyzing) [Gemmataceae bacterium]
MCGIAGYTGEEIDGLLPAMLARMRHRGPDDEGTYDGDGVRLGMVRLSIIDVGGSRQPISNEDGTVWIVYNGEVYNYIELRAELEAKGHRFRTAGDTETIVHGYEEYGLDVFHKLNGFFALALCDARARRLVVARDRFGVKPLFYAPRPGGFAFASEIKALLCHPAVGRDTDEEALSYYLSLRHVPAPHTIYKDVRALLPGHLLTWDGASLTTRRWYRLPTAVAWSDADEEEVVERIDTLLRDSVRLRMRSDVAFGAYLSGGIDSSTVVAMMTEFSSRPVKTFSLAFADAPAHKQDAHYARIVARHYGTDHHECVMSWRDLERDLPAVVEHLDQPFAGVTSSWWLSRFIARHVKVALAGEGADDAFGSYGHHRLVGALAAVERARAEGTPIERADLGFFQDRPDFVLSLAGQAPWEWRLAYAAFTEREKAELLSRRGGERLAHHSAAEFLKGVYREAGDGLDPLTNMLYLDVNTLLPNELLYYGDLLSMAHSLEARAPFLDYRLVELAFSIPGSLKIRGRTLKYVLRRVAAKYLPREILDRPKEGFVLPNNTWLRAPLAGLVRDGLAARRLRSHDYFNPAYVEALVGRFLAGDESATFKVWTLLNFQQWYEGQARASAGRSAA